MQLSGRMKQARPGIFHTLYEHKTRLINQGRRIYDLSVGTPGFLPDPHITAALSEAAADGAEYGYAMADLPALKAAMQAYYRERFGVVLRSNQLTAVHGTQEGMAHICWAVCDPGDVVLVPDPGYPIFTDGPSLCGAVVETYPLYEEKNYILDFSDLPEALCRRAKVIVVSYPLNPVCAAADADFYERLIRFAKKYEILVIHDAAYADIAFGEQPYPSFLSFPGAEEVGVEFYSLSKTYNFTGARLAFMLGNEAVVQALQTVRSQIDYGIFLPIQKAAIAALSGDQSGVVARRKAYQQMAERLTAGLNDCGWPVQASRGTMFLWAKLPYGYTDSLRFTLELMDATGVIATPGVAFGQRGEGYIRFALRTRPDELEAVIAAVSAGRDRLIEAAGEER